MKLVCYGASVTAQQKETGYFQQLESASCASQFESIEKVAFGASQFEYAGYAFMRDVLEKKPDLCVIDWLTPSMKGFNEFKIDLLNQALLEINCLPIWVFFPRTDNFDNIPEAYNQVLKSAERFGVSFLDLRDYLVDFTNDPQKYLRDAVHTTLEGAKCYAKVINQKIESVLPSIGEHIARAKLSQGYSDTSQKNLAIPLIKPVIFTLNSNTSAVLEFDFKGGLFEVFFEAEIGPFICYWDFTLYHEEEIIYKETLNNADPWCFYRRSMVIETIRKRLAPGSYKLHIKKRDGNPMLEKTTRKPIEEHWEDKDRFIEIKRVSVTADNFNMSVIRSES